jgi:hypothetical protein
VIGVATIILALVVIMELVRRRKLRTGYSLLWLFVGLIVLVLAVWTDLVEYLTRLLGVRSPGSMLFAAGILFTLLLLLEHSLALSSLWHDNKVLTQEVALLEWRVRQLEASQADEPATDSDASGRDRESARGLVPRPEEEIFEPAT